jgi:hypothetical protein
MSALIESSSFGTPGAKALRARTPQSVVDRILAKVGVEVSTSDIPAPWRDLPDTCQTCGGRGYLLPPGTTIGSVALAESTPCPDCVAGRPVHLLQATCHHPDRSRIGRYGHFECSACGARCDPDTGYRWRPHPGRVDLGRFTVQIVPLDGDQYRIELERQP